MEYGKSSHMNESEHAAAMSMVVPARKEHGLKTPITAFQDNFEHLQALEREAKYLLAAAVIRRWAEHGIDSGNSGEDVRKSFSFLPSDASLQDIQLALDKMIFENRERENITFQTGIKLNFNSFVAEWGLDQFERTVLLLLLMRYTAPEFNSMYENCKFEENCRGGYMEVGSLLAVICRQFRDQLISRRYFSIDGTLMREGIVRLRDEYGDSGNILNEDVHLDERVVQHILGDNNLYSTAFRFIKIEKSNVKLDQVVLADGLKEDIAGLTRDYLEGRNNGTMVEIDEFYSYGTGLVFMFYGPSGTGKTMLSRALASNFNRPLISMSLEDMHRAPVSAEDILAMVFKEAALRGGIVLLDECDDIFEKSSHLNRALLLEIERARCIVILATNKPVALDPALERRVAMKVHFQMPDSAMRLKLWKALLPEAITLAGDVDLGDLAGRYQFSGGLIKNCIFLASMKAIRGKNGAGPALTRDQLEYAANLQKSALAEKLLMGSPYAPSGNIDRLPLRPVQKDQLKRIVQVWTSSKLKSEGLNIFICTSNVKVGLMTAEALAEACGIRVRKFPLKKLLGSSVAEDDKLIDPITQRKMTPLDYAFAGTVGEACMTLFSDDEGEFETALRLNKDSDTSKDLLLSKFIEKLRGHNGFTCTVSQAVHLKKLPVEFHLNLFLEHPPEETQVRGWENHFGKGAISDEDLVKLVERYPMHLPEIDELAHRAWIRAFMRKGRDEITLSDVCETIAQYRFSNDAPALFGGRP